MLTNTSRIPNKPPQRTIPALSKIKRQDSISFPPVFAKTLTDPLPTVFEKPTVLVTSPTHSERFRTSSLLPLCLTPEPVAHHSTDAAQHSSSMKTSVNGGMNPPPQQLPSVSMRGLLGGSTSTRGAVGLDNLGNTCFMNATLNCVMRVRSLLEYIKGGMWTTDVKREKKTKGAITESFSALCTKVFTHDSGSVSPHEFRNAITSWARTFSNYHQHDAQ
eukprot:PhF_6_TR27159/c0_g1_i2/m.39715